MLDVLGGLTKRRCVVAWAVRTNAFLFDGFVEAYEACVTLRRLAAVCHVRHSAEANKFKKTHVPDEIQFLTKPQIALALINEAPADGITVKAWTFDELYGRDGKFLDGLSNEREISVGYLLPGTGPSGAPHKRYPTLIFRPILNQRKQAFVGEVPPDFSLWTRKPRVLRKRLKNTKRKGKGSRNNDPRRAARDAKAYEVRNLAIYSPGLATQTPQRYRGRDSHKGPEIWEVRWHVCYRKTHDGRLVSSQCTLIVAENIRTEK